MDETWTLHFLPGKAAFYIDDSAELWKKSAGHNEDRGCFDL